MNSDLTGLKTIDALGFCDIKYANLQADDKHFYVFEVDNNMKPEIMPIIGKYIKDICPGLKFMIIKKGGILVKELSVD